MSKPRYGWDSACFLAYLNDEKERVPACEEVLNYAEDGNAELVISSLVLCEVVHLKERVRMTSDKESKIQDLFEKPYIIPVDVNRRVAEFSRQLLWKNLSLKPKDAVHVASAIIGEVIELHTFDEPLIELSGKIENLVICKPKIDKLKKPLFDGLK